MIVELKDLAAFHVQEVCLDGPDPRLVGHFNHLRGVREERSWLYAGDQSLVGDVTDVNQYDLSAVFVAPFWSAESPIQAGSTAPWIDGYWQAYHVTMIVGRDATWRRETFVVDGVPNLQPRGWDHEECRICDAHVGRGGRPYGFVNPDAMWLCKDCHERYALKRNLEFLMGE